MRLFLGGVELFDKSRGGDETRHRYLTHSEWHTDSKFVGLLKVGYQASILEIKFKKEREERERERKCWGLFGRPRARLFMKAVHYG